MMTYFISEIFTQKKKKFKHFFKKIFRHFIINNKMLNVEYLDNSYTSSTCIKHITLNKHIYLLKFLVLQM